MKFCEVCMAEIDTKDGENRCPDCDDLNECAKIPHRPELDAAAKRQKTRAKIQRKQRHEILTGLGLTRVKGALGGIYYE